MFCLRIGIEIFGIILIMNNFAISLRFLQKKEKIDGCKE